MIQWKLQVQVSGTYFFPRIILLGLVWSLKSSLEVGTLPDLSAFGGQIGFDIREIICEE